MVFVLGGLAVIAQTERLNDPTRKFVDAIHEQVPPHRTVTSDDIAEAADKVFGEKKWKFTAPIDITTMIHRKVLK